MAFREWIMCTWRRCYCLWLTCIASVTTTLFTTRRINSFRVVRDTWALYFSQAPEHCVVLL